MNKKNHLSSFYFVRTMRAGVILLLLMLTVGVNSYGQFIGTKGNTMVDSNGNTIVMKGMNLGNWLLWEGYLMMGDYNYRTHTQFLNSVSSAFGNNMTQAKEFEHQWRMNYVTEQTILDLKDRGFNSVRVPFHYNMFWDGTKVKDDGFQYLDRLIGFCRSNGIYVLLDMHAAPGYQNPGDHSDNVNSNSSQPRGSVTFWDGNSIAVASAVWKHIANYYKNEPVVWGYDLINEPVPQDGREYELLPSLITLKNAIREVDTNHIIVAEGSWWGSDMQKLDWQDSQVQSKTGIKAQWDSKLVYETHHYSTDLSLLTPRLAITNKLNIPLIMGEYGESDNTNLRKMSDWCIANNVGYFPWSFKKMSFDKCLWTINPNANYNSVKNYINNGGTLPANAYTNMISFCQNNIANGAAGIIYHQDFYDAVKYTLPTYVTLPALIQAESYAYMSGIQLETTSDTNGGQNVGFLDATDWLDYTINVSTSGSYKIEFRVASLNGGGQLTTSVNGATLATTNIASTTGWQTWTTISQLVTLTSGNQKLRITVNTGGWNFNWLNVSKEITTSLFPKVVPAINIYPNPATSSIFVTGVNDDAILKIFNSSGILMSQTQGNTASVAELTNGLYVLQSRSEQLVQQIKFIKR